MMTTESVTTYVLTSINISSLFIKIIKNKKGKTKNVSFIVDNDASRVWFELKRHQKRVNVTNVPNSRFYYSAE